jgi:hypothetical protein
MTESEKFVRSKWHTPGVYRDGNGWYALNVFPGLQNLDGPVVRSRTRALAWKAAEDFTISHLEAIRQIKEEIRELWLCDEDDWRRIIFDECESGRSIASRVVRQCRLRRAMARLEVIRDDLKRGMKP